MRSSATARVVFSCVFAASTAVAAQAPQPPKDKGAELYARMCSVCHGPKGEGYKADRAPALSDRDFLSSVSDGFLRRAIADGRAGTTMSAWGVEHGGPLAEADIQALIAYMRAWDPKAKAKLDERPLTGDAGRGAALFAAKCAACHGPKGVEGPDLHIGDAALLASAGNGFLRYAVEKGRKDTAMPGFAKPLGDGGVEDIVAYLRGLQAAAPVPAKAVANPAPLTLGPVPLNPTGPQPEGFVLYPGVTPGAIIKAQLDRGAKFGILDARAPADYTREHIAGAVSVPFYDPSPYFAKLPKDVWLVCYCACPHAESGQLAQKLLANGFSKVTVLDEGFGFWKKNQYATRAGGEP